MNGAGFEIVYADPPWSYNDKRHGYGGAEDHYPTMRTEELCAMQVREISAKNSALFLWATMPCLPDALNVIQSWGFVYKTAAFVWIKQNPKKGGVVWGLGSYTRSNAELCLLGIRGRMRAASRKVHQIVFAPRGRHSAKPPEVRKRIVQLFGNRKRIELFARERAPGWHVWGNEV